MPKFNVSFTIEGTELNEYDELNEENLEDVILSNLNVNDALDYYSNRSVDTKVTGLTIQKV